MLLCTIQQSNNHTILWCFGKPNSSICECKYSCRILWTKLFVVSKIDQWLSLKVRSHPLLMQMNFPSLFGGNVLCLVHVKTTWRGRNNPSVDDEIMNVTYLLSSIPNTLMCFAPLLSHVHFPTICTRYNTVWYCWPLRLKECCKFLQGKQPCNPSFTLTDPNHLEVYLLMLFPLWNFNSCITSKIDKSILLWPWNLQMHCVWHEEQKILSCPAPWVI